MLLKKYDISLYLMMISTGEKSSKISTYIKNIPEDILQKINHIINENKQLVPYNGNYLGNDNNYYSYKILLLPRSYFNDLEIYIELKRNNNEIMKLTLQPIKKEDITNLKLGDIKNIGSLTTYNIDLDNKMNNYYSSINDIFSESRGLEISEFHEYIPEKKYKYCNYYKLNSDYIPKELSQNDLENPIKKRK